MVCSGVCLGSANHVMFTTKSVQVDLFQHLPSYKIANQVKVIGYSDVCTVTCHVFKSATQLNT